MQSPNDSTVPRHPIAVVSERTGLSQDVLRVWERRYAAVTPTRGPGGQRLYADADITRLRLLRSVTEAGRSISQMATLPPADLAALAAEDAASRVEPSSVAPETPALQSVVTTALGLTLELDAAGLESELRRAVGLHGLPSFLDEVATPLLRRIGEEWHAGRLTPSQEHMASAVVMAVLLDLTRAVTPAYGAPRFLLATPSGERHAIGAVMAGLAASLEGWRVVFLGADLPASEVASAAVQTGARAVGLSLVYVAAPEAALAQITEVRAGLPRNVPLFLGGAGSSSLRGEIARGADGVVVFNDLGSLRAALREVAAA